MALVTDCFVAGGTLMVIFGSGLQAYTELSRSRELMKRLGWTETFEAATRLLGASSFLLVAFSNPAVIIIPGPSALWHLPRNVKNLVTAIKAYINAASAIGKADLTEVEGKEARALYMKAGYWSLIMLGSILIFAGTCVAIVQGLRSSAGAG